MMSLPMPDVETRWEANHSDHPITCLSGEQLSNLKIKRGVVSFHLTKGRAWVTYDDNDVIVEKGETIYIPSSKHPVLISSANPSRAICYQMN